MIIRTEYDAICTAAAELQEPYSLELHVDIRQRLGTHIGGLFPLFKEAFPLTVAAMEMYWPAPIAAFENYRQHWLIDFVCEHDNLNLYFALRYKVEDTFGPDFDQSHAMLPSRWVELYRYFESFVITPNSRRPLTWINTPFHYSGRREIEDVFAERLNMKKRWGKQLADKLGVDHHYFNCWLFNDNQDALFLDEKRNDHKVYHLNGRRHEDVVVLADPETKLDEYLAHVVAGGKPADFNWRD